GAIEDGAPDSWGSVHSLPRKGNPQLLAGAARAVDRRTAAGAARARAETVVRERVERGALSDSWHGANCPEPAAANPGPNPPAGGPRTGEANGPAGGPLHADPGVSPVRSGVSRPHRPGEPARSAGEPPGRARRSSRRERALRHPLLFSG